MQIDFWDSLYNTNRYNMTLDDYARKKYGRYFNGLDVLERNTVYSGLKSKKTHLNLVPMTFSLV
jgi:hypothetical protein